MPVVNVSRIPSGAAGSAVDQVAATNELPVPSGDGSGAFRTVCEFSHMAFDDPIVLPGQPGRSHLHAFFGNTGLNGNSTAASIASTGRSTCRGGTVNRSAYWVPAMIDTRDGTPLKPAEASIYYKTAWGITARTVQPFPAGLRMIAGDAKNAARIPEGFTPIVDYTCEGGSDQMLSQSIPNCPVGTELWQHINFPQCWDGVNLDSPDHKSHMAYINERGCPASHPVSVPSITFNIIYKVSEANAPRRWRLASDNYDASLPGGYSSHGDWFNGWKPDVMDTFVKFCNQAEMDCHSHLLGDGRMIY